MKELMEIQSELSVPKDQYNKFGKYNYRSCEDILEKVKPLLKAKECLLIISDDMVEVGGRVYVKATATLTNSEGTTITITGYAREADTRKGMNADQLTGATSSYARKYCLNGLFCIDDSKDSDATNKHGSDKKPATKPQANMPGATTKPTTDNDMTKPQRGKMWATACDVWPQGVQQSSEDYKAYVKDKLVVECAGPGWDLDSLTKWQASALIETLVKKQEASQSSGKHSDEDNIPY